MITGPVLIDTNVLILFIVGSTGRSIVAAHKRCNNQFSEEDFDLLLAVLGDAPELILLPNVVTEASNLLAQIANPYKDALLRTLKVAVLTFREVYVASRTAVERAEFKFIRLTDCALLDTRDKSFHLLTVDLDLYLAFSRAGRPATNFRHVIDHSS
jgi:hypothetical protein